MKKVWGSFRRQEGETDEDENERMWVSVAGKTNLNTGLVYKRPLNAHSKEGNARMITQLTKEVEELQEKGEYIILLGDFNAHTHQGEGGPQTLHKTNACGRDLLAIKDAVQLIMLNGSNISKGTWKWMSRNQKLVKDYCLVSPELFPKVNEIWLDDT